MNREVVRNCSEFFGAKYCYNKAFYHAGKEPHFDFQTYNLIGGLMVMVMLARENCCTSICSRKFLVCLHVPFAFQTVETEILAK